MGGGTTIVEGSRLGMQMYGCDLNPVAWFIVNNEMAKVDPADVQALLDEIEAEVKPQIMPFYACDCPRGHKGKWTRISTGEVMKADFDPLALEPSQRKHFQYEGPEVVYVFWAKHGPCQATECSHRTPIMTSPVVAIKTLTVKAWMDFECTACKHVFDVEAFDPRLAPNSPLVVSSEERDYSVLRPDASVLCPACHTVHRFPNLSGKGENKKVNLSLVIHPDWLAGAPNKEADELHYGGSSTDTATQSAAWFKRRSQSLRFIEVRGTLPESLTCPISGLVIDTGISTVPKDGAFTCGACGKQQELVDSVSKTKTNAPLAPYLVQAYCPSCAANGWPYGGRFFTDSGTWHTAAAAESEWEQRQHADLLNYWPTIEIPYGHRTHQARSDRQTRIHALLEVVQQQTTFSP